MLIASATAEVDVLTNHWDPFFVGIAGKFLSTLIKREILITGAESDLSLSDTP